MKPLIFLGIDQSLNHTGIVSLAGDGTVIHAEEWRLSSSKKYPTEEHKYVELYNRATALLELFPPVIAVFEDFSHGSVGRKYTLGGAYAAIAMAVHTYNVPIIKVAPKTRAKYATGKGSASKNQVKNGVKASWGYETNNDNIADAYTLAEIGRGFCGLAKPSVRYRLETIHSLQSAAPQVVRDAVTERMKTE